MLLAKNNRLNDSFLSNFFGQNDLYSNMFGEVNHGTIDIDAEETDSAFIIKADVPGVKSSDLKIKYEDRVLTIETSRESSRSEKSNHYCFQERSVGRQSRSIRFKEDIKEGDISAELKDGVLIVNVPKEKARKAIEITVK